MLLPSLQRGRTGTLPLRPQLHPLPTLEFCRAHCVVRPRVGLRRWRGKIEWRGTGVDLKRRVMAGDDTFSSSSNSMPASAEDGDAFCIIEGRETVLDFAQMQVQEIRDNITSRRNKIFLLMEEVRRLRIQQRMKSADTGVKQDEEIEEMLEYPSSIPLFPPITTTTLKQYYATCLSMGAAIILFGGLIAPILELKLGIGGTSYEDFIRSVHLPPQLSDVDPIVASFSGGAVGVISIAYGYLACARCSGSGALLVVEPVASISYSDRPLSAPTTQRCPNCSGAAKVMCPTCLCTGMALASEHDPRIDPFQFTSLLETRPYR